jgi:hypothetical protein
LRPAPDSLPTTQGVLNPMKIAAGGLLAALLAAVALSAGPAAAAARPEVKRVRLSNLVRPARPFRDTILRARVPRAVDRPSDTGGTYTTPDGTAIKVVVSASYQPDETRNQGLADFFGSLVHGTELSAITVDMRTLPEVQGVCGGEEALACYDPNAQTLFVPGEDPEGVPLEQILAHEYGHHVAFSRLNPPWNAYVLGPKRWASYQNLCEKAVNGQVFPGDEGEHYTLNPGEGWAETYRVLNARRIGTWTDIGWPIVDASFMPSDPALALAEQDVVQPWTGPTVVKTIKGTLKRRELRKWRLTPVLDGTAVATVHAVKGARTAFFDPLGKQISNGAGHSSLTICGQRQMYVAVQGTGKFTLTYSLP